MTRPSLTTDRIYAFPEFDFIRAGRYSTSMEILLYPTDEIATIDGHIVCEDNFDRLYSMGSTITDGVQINPKFMEFISPKVEGMVRDLDHPTSVHIEFHSLMLHEETGFDMGGMQHSSDRIMTLMVQLPTYIEDGELVIDDKTVIGHPDEGNIKLSLFYTDRRFSIKTLYDGCRITLRFDVIQHPNDLVGGVIEKHRQSFERGIAELRKRNVKKIGIPTNHIYTEDDWYRDARRLKGVDRIVAELLLWVVHDPHIKGIAHDGEQWFYKSMLPVVCMNQIFTTLFMEPEMDDDTLCKISTLSGVCRKGGYDDITVYHDRKKYRMIKAKYLMGETVLLLSDGYLKDRYTVDPDIRFEDGELGRTIGCTLGLFVSL